MHKISEIIRATPDAPVGPKDIEGLLTEIDALSAEVKRLKAGDFTEEEFQNFCHNRSVQEGACRFREGCERYTEKLFGHNLWELPVLRARWDKASGHWVIYDREDKEPPDVCHG